MKALYSYSKENGKWIWMTLGLGSLLGADMLLNQIALREIIYGIGLYCFVLLGILGWDFSKFYRRYLQLKELEKRVGISLDGLPEPANFLEEEYQYLLQILIEDKWKSRMEIEKKKQ